MTVAETDDYLIGKRVLKCADSVSICSSPLSVLSRGARRLETVTFDRLRKRNGLSSVAPSRFNLMR